VFITARHLFLSWASSTHSTSSHIIYFRLILNIILPFTLGLPGVLCLYIFPPNVWMHLSFLRKCHMTSPSNPSWFAHPSIISKKCKSWSFSLLFLYHLSKSLSYIISGLPVVASLQILRPKFCTCIMSLSCVPNNEMF